MNRAKNLEFPLFHGTSSLFIQSISTHGLGAVNPLEAMNLFKLAERLVPIIDTELMESDQYLLARQALGFMVEQKNEAMNFEHGQTYLTPSLSTAIRYTSSNRYGSEFLSHVLFFLEKLVNKNVREVTEEVYGEFPSVFQLLRINPAPILLIIFCPASSLLDEHGKSAKSNIDRCNEVFKENPRMMNIYLQQTNFRLNGPIAPEDCRFLLVDVTEPNEPFPEFGLYPISPANLSQEIFNLVGGQKT